MSTFIMWALVVWFALGAAGTIAQVGKPRSETSAGTAIVVVAIQALIVVAIVTHWEAP